MSEKRQEGTPDSTSERLPHKPTRESVTGSESPEQAFGQRRVPAGDRDQELGEGREQREQSAADRPHATENDADAPLQEDRDAEAASLPANASGRDAVPVSEQDEPIDPGSMYDRRPERDKDQPPSERES